MPDLFIHVVDDMKAMRTVVTHIITASGVSRNVTQHPDAKSFLRSLMAGAPCDLVVSDWNMPEMTGLDMLKTLRGATDDKVRRMPVILLTGEAKMENILDAKKAGVSDYIVKPVTPDVLLRKIARVATRCGYTLPATAQVPV